MRRISLASCRTFPGQRYSTRYSIVSSARRRSPLPAFLRVLLQVVVGEGRDLDAPLAQRRHVEADDVQAVEEVFAEAALATRASRSALVAAMTRTSTLDRLRFADRVDLARLEEAEELGLHVERRFANLVEEQGAAGGGADDARRSVRWRR